MNSKKVILFWLLVVTGYNFFDLFQILGETFKKFLSNTGYLNKFKKSNTLRF